VAEVMSASVADLKTGRPVRRSYQVRWATESDVPAVTAFFGPDRPITDRVHRGDRCLLATVRDEICAAVWFSPGPKSYMEDVGDLGCEFIFPNRVAFSYDGKGTRLGAWGTLMARAPELLPQIGVEEIVTLIDYDNPMSINSHRSLGYHRLGLVGCLRLAWWIQPIYWDGGHLWRMLPGRVGPLELRRTKPARPRRAAAPGATSQHLRDVLAIPLHGVKTEVGTAP
jgi:hypothetical protein